jgi:hypothetical protein
VHGIYQGRASAIFSVKLIQIHSCEHEGRYLPIIEANAGQIAAAGEQVST